MSDTVQLFVDAWKLMVGRLPQGIIREDPDVVSCLGNVPLALLNVSVICRPAKSQDDLQYLLTKAASNAAQCSFPATVLLRHDWLPTGWEAVTAEAGLAPMIPLTGMEAKCLLPPKRSLPILDIRRVTDSETARDLARVNALAYLMAPDVFDCIANVRFWQRDSYACVGYLDGQPVTCASALPVNGTVYVALVATLPGEQGKGYAEAVMRQVVTHAQQAMKATRTTLHASEMGIPVYTRMGFTPGPRMLILGPAQSVHVPLD